MANVFVNMFSIKELRERLIFTIMALIIFRLGSYIPTPGVNIVELHQAMGGNNPFTGGMLGIFNLFSGGALSQISIFALGIMPYISASIIMNLLQAVMPALKRMQQEGEHGRRRINQITRLGTIGLCIIQSLGLFMVIDTQFIANASPDTHIIFTEDGKANTFFIINFILIQTTGTMFLLWIGEQVTERGVGNGASLIIFGGIVAQVPQASMSLGMAPEINQLDIIIIIMIFIGITIVVCAEQQSVRRIPVQYARRVVGGRAMQGGSSYIPFKMNPAGVIPIIFASAVVMIPQQLLMVVGQGNITDSTLMNINNQLAPGSVTYIILFFILTMVFAFFYTQIYFNPVDMSENLKKSGGFVPGIRSGPHTADFLTKVLNRITLPGSIFLGFIAIFPYVVLPLITGISFGAQQGSQSFQFVQLLGGTSLLIMVGVGLDTVRQIESHLLMRNYSGFLKKSKIRGRR